MTLIVNRMIIRKVVVQQCKRVVAAAACTVSQMHLECLYQHIHQILGCMLETKRKLSILCYLIEIESELVIDFRSAFHNSPNQKKTRNI